MSSHAPPGAWPKTLPPPNAAQVSGFMLNDACVPLQPMFDILAAYALLDADQAQCFYVGADIRRGMPIMFLAALFNNVAAQIVVRSAEAAVEEREAKGPRRRGRSVHPPRSRHDRE